MKRRKSSYMTTPLINYVLRLEYLTMPAIEPRRRR